MKTLILFFSLALGVSSFAAGPRTLSDLAWYRKISIHLRGTEPTADDYEQLKAAIANGTSKAWIENKIDEAFKTDDYANRMQMRLFEHFRFNLQTRFSSDVKAGPTDVATDRLFRQGKENLSWDDLWLASDYKLDYPTSVFSLTSERAVYADLAKDAMTATRIAFPADDDRVAGVITTPRFLQRYQNAAINKNRRRAAAMFRLFLCDVMVPVIPADGNQRDEQLGVAFPDQGSKEEADLRRELMSSTDVLHGRQETCMACHSKLDPMGRVFQGMGAGIHHSPFPGKLVFKGDDGRAVNEPVSGIGSMVRLLVKQPEYVKCQMKFFWDEFIGNDVPMDQKAETELATMFDRVNRRTNDIVKAMVYRPEFRENPQDRPVTWTSIRNDLKRCDTCHDSEGDIPSFSVSETIGFSGTRAEHHEWIDKMWDRVNRPDGARGKMPKRSNEWDPQVLTKIKKWLDQERSQP